MPERMEKLPVSHEQVRSLMLEALGKLEDENPQIDSLNKVLGKLACERQLVPDPNGPNPGRNSMYFLNPQDAARVQDVFWDFIVEGVVRPGLGNETGNITFRFFTSPSMASSKSSMGLGLRTILTDIFLCFNLMSRRSIRWS